MRPKRLAPEDPIPGLERATMAEFWSWAYSNPLMNIERGAFAEFVVGHALGVVDGVRQAWDPLDLVYKGRGIEVKSSAYVQAWKQKKPSRPTFDIEAKTAWVDDLSRWDPERMRRADVYVFCLYLEQRPDKANILDVRSWEFYVLPTSRINAEIGAQKRVGLPRIKRMTGAVGYEGIKERVDRLLI